MILVMSFLIVVLASVVFDQRIKITNLKTQMFNYKISHDLEYRGAVTSDEYSMEVPPPIPRILQ